MKHQYQPRRFFLTVFALTWLFWIAAAVAVRTPAGEGAGLALMLLGLLVPAVTAVVTVHTSRCAALKRDFGRKLFGVSRVKPRTVLTCIAVFAAVIAASILLSTLVGESLDQFALVEGFSFSIGGISTLLTLVLTALLEELGWRGYAMDSLAAFFTWRKATLLFGAVWALWHLPLFFIPGTYQHTILRESPWFMVNFSVSTIPMVFLFTWLYVKNNRSILACVFFHFVVNLMQEQIAMTPVTKCVETAVLFAVAAIIAVRNRDAFWGEKHSADLLAE